jgi:hypothetical protein
MSDCAIHCPFLNRDDTRCSDRMALDHLQDGFTFCFGAYKTCPVYAELLAERQQRRAVVILGKDAHAACHANLHSAERSARLAAAPGR